MFAQVLSKYLLTEWMNEWMNQQLYVNGWKTGYIRNNFLSQLGMLAIPGQTEYLGTKMFYI